MPDGSTRHQNQDAQLIDNGYEPVAVNGKRALGKEWSTRPNTLEAIAAERKARPGATNTGLRTGELSGVDIDLIPAAHVEAIKKVAAEVLGDTPFERVGSKGAMLCYRNTAPISKITIAGTDADGKPRKVEILGTGQQFVAYGIHPDTWQDYKWVGDAEPVQNATWELPLVTPEKLREFAQGVAKKLTELGYRNVSTSNRGDPTKRATRDAQRRQDKVPVPLEELQEILGHIDPGCERTDWIGILGGIQSTNLRDVPEDEMDDHLLEVAQAWSRGDYQKGPSPANWVDDGDVDTAFWTLSADKPGGTTFGTLYHQARENGYTKPAPGQSDKEAFASAFAEPSGDESLFSTGKDQRLRDPRPLEELIPGLIEKHCVAYLSGEGGTHKSRIAQHWGACVHTGCELYGRQVERARFVHVSYEDGADEDARRQNTLIRRLGLAHDALDDTVYCGWKGRGPLVVVNEDGVVVPTPLWSAFEAKMQTIPGHKFIVFDSSYNVFGFKGNAKISETAVQCAIDWLDNQMIALDASGLMLTHPSQAGLARGDNSGWSVAWVNRPRVRLKTTATDRENTVELAVTKRNHTVKAKPLTLHWSDGLMLPDGDEDQEQAVYEACVQVATNACNGGIPITRGRQQNLATYREAVEQECGVRPSARELRRQLEVACMRGRLVYRPYDNSKRGDEARAGYFLPF